MPLTTFKTHLQTIHYFTEDLGNGITMDLVYIPGGTFLMGAPETELESLNQERPQHQVTVPAFFMGATPITQAQWRQVASSIGQGKEPLEANPSRFSFRGDNHPVERVSWHDATEFCLRLSRHTKREYRLPSEAEWEYVCRAGTTTPFHCGETILTDLANYNGNYVYGSGAKGGYRETITPVDTFPPNAFGLYDMHGNVWEWCQDSWHDSYEKAPTDGSAWVSRNSSTRVLRGGSWVDYPRLCRSASRFDYYPVDRVNGLGFRVVCCAPRTQP